jgi:hypothetical protein
MVRMTARSQLDARSALAALRAIGPDAYRCDADDPGRWQARCPHCRGRSLVIAETTEGGRVTIGCRHRCCEPKALADLLQTDPVILAERARADRWQAFATWAIEFAQRQLDLDSGVTI